MSKKELRKLEQKRIKKEQREQRQRMVDQSNKKHEERMQKILEREKKEEEEEAKEARYLKELEDERKRKEQEQYEKDMVNFEVLGEGEEVNEVEDEGELLSKFVEYITVTPISQSNLTLTSSGRWSSWTNSAASSTSPLHSP